MDTVRLARDFGSVSELAPDWCDDLRDLPHTLFEAVRMGTIFISFDELPADERPDKRIWLDAPALKEHFDGVKAKREREARGDRGVEDAVENDAAKGLIVG